MGQTVYFVLQGREGVTKIGGVGKVPRADTVLQEVEFAWEQSGFNLEKLQAEGPRWGTGLGVEIVYLDCTTQLSKLGKTEFSPQREHCASSTFLG